MFLDTRDDLSKFENDFRLHLGGVWERLVRETLARQPLPESDIRWRKVARWWGSGTNHQPMELDVVAESEDGKTLLVGEAKLSLRAAEAPRCQAALEEKAKALPFAGRYENIGTRLFVADSSSADVISQAWCETIS